MKGKSVIITGASSGIGNALAFHYAKAGAQVAINGRDPEKLERAASALKQTGAQILSVPGDVSIERDCELLVNKTLSTFGGVDILINNAGISMRGLFQDTSLSVLHKVFDINFWGTVYCTRYALPAIIRSRGSIVGISSIAGKIGLPGRTAYSASKFALEGFLKTIRIENIKNGVHVLVACPGFTASNIRLTSLGPDGKPQGESPRNESGMMSAEQAAEAIARAISRRKRDLVLSTEGKLTVMINKLFPAWLDRMVYQKMAKEPGSPFK